MMHDRVRIKWKPGLNVNPSRNVLKNSDIKHIDKNETNFFDLYFNVISKLSPDRNIVGTQVQKFNFIFVDMLNVEIL